MKLIDLINKMYKNQIETGFKFTLRYKEFTLNTYEIRECEYGLMIWDLDNDCRFDSATYILDYLDYEVVEEKPKKIDELDYRLSYAVYYECKCEIDKVMTLIRPILENKNKINELAKAVNYLLEKNDE